MAEKDSSGCTGPGCFGCFAEIVGLAAFVLFFLGACAPDPDGTGFEHDFKAGFARIANFGRDVWETSKE